MKQIVFLVCLIMLVSVSVSNADTVFLINGKQVKGQIQDETETVLTVVTTVGQLQFDKKEVLHIERDIEGEEGEQFTFWQKTIKFYEDFTRNSFSLPRRTVRKYHIRLFTNLQKIPFYRAVTEYSLIAAYRSENPGPFKLAVYMVLLLLLGFALKIVKSILVIIWCKIFRIRERYDL